MEIKQEVHPVGQVIDDEHISRFVETMKTLWDSTKEKVEWWKFWKRVSPVPVTNFLLKCLDDLIAYVDQIVDASGEDKKATVLNAIGRIYDYVVREAMPLCLVPFSGVIRAYIINTLASAAIDWMIQKYRHGNWRPKPVEEIQSQWAELHFQMLAK